MNKKFLSLMLVLVMMISLGAIAIAASNSQVVTGPTSRIWQDGFGFHCSECGGNGATAVIYKGNDAAVIKAIAGIKKQPAGSLKVEKGDQKDIFGTKTYPITLERVGDTTIWNLITGDDIECATCGRTDWVTYSNNSGVIDGKNIQAHHPILPSPPPHPEFHASLSFEKKVNGAGILEWLTDSIWAADAIDIIEGLEFYLTGDDNDNKYGPVTPDIGTGRVVFPHVEPGVYVLSEVVTGAAAGKLAAIDPITIEILEGDDNFVILSGNSSSWGFEGSGSVTIPEGPFQIRIDYNDGPPLSMLVDVDDALAESMFSRGLISSDVTGTILYSSIPTYDDWYFGPRVFEGQEATTGLNLWGADDVAYGSLAAYKLKVTDGEGIEHISFCGDMWAKTHQIDVEPGSVVSTEKEALLIAALEYVNATYGPLSADMNQFGRVLSQILVTRIVHDEITKIEMTQIDWNVGHPADIYETVADEILALDLLAWYADRVAGLDSGVNYVAGILTLVDASTHAGGKYQPQIVPYFGEIGGGFYINNEPAKPNASLSFEKKVEGENIVEWLLDSKWAADAADILAGLEFTLTGVDNGNVYGPVTPDLMTGLVAFNDIVPGTYILSEQIKGAAVGKFFAIENITLIISGGEDKYTAIGGAVTSSGFGESISDGDFFTIVNGYGSGYVLGYPGLNNSGDIFPIAVTSVPGGVVYPSFCAHGGSRAFAGQSGLGCAGYVVASPSLMAINEPQAKDVIDFVKAYNYIEDNYGDLNDFRPVTQIVTWTLLGQIDIDSVAFANINWGAIEAGGSAVKGVADAEAIVRDVIANYGGYTGGGNIASVMYMVCEHHHSLGDCQPQLVPVYGTFYVENKPAHFSGGVKFSKVMYGGLLDYIDVFNLLGVVPEFSFDLYKIDNDNNEEFIKTYYTDVNGEVAIAELEPGRYVFKEVFGYAEPFFFGEPGELFDEDGNDIYGTWGFVWAAHNNDELYFTMPAAGGDAVWDDGYDLGEDGNPIVDNWLLCKHNIMWSSGYNYHGGCVENPNGSGWHVHHEGNAGDFCGGWLEAWYIPATCDKPARIAFGCTAGCGVGTGIETGPALGHDVDYNNPTAVYFVNGQPAPGTIVYGCTRCDYTETVNDLALWLKLTGWSNPYQGY